MVIANMARIPEVSEEVYHDFMKIMELYKNEGYDWSADDLMREMLWWWNYK